MLWEPEQLKNRIREKLSKESFAWLLHFENRYRTIDSLLSPAGYSNVLEIASGFSFRGLELCRQHAITYLDTDLPDSITTKQLVVDKLIEKHHLETKGAYRLMPLNVLDAAAFHAVIDQFPPGPVAIVNEGLLMYLDEGEKRQLCANIHAALLKRGGCWITGDIYLKKGEREHDHRNATVAAFLAMHNVEEKKFDSFEAAETFFTSCGFTIAAKEMVAYDQLSALRFIEHRNIPEEVVRSWFTTRQTWMLVGEGSEA